MRQKGWKDKTDIIVDSMMQQLKIKEKEKEQNKKQAAMEESLARAKEHDEKLLNIFEAFMNHIMGNTAVQE